MSTTPNPDPVGGLMLSACSTPTLAGSPVIRAIRHHLAAGGNRVRAHFSLDASRRLGVNNEDAITLAAICELLHNASLIQDDLIDRAPTRRGLPSVWASFDDSTAVCAGDLLLASAFGLVGEIRCVEFLAPVLRLVHRRTRDIIVGQGDEMTSSPASLSDYELLASGKSASLLSLPFELPLLLSGHHQFLELARGATQAFAVAYQMVDDLSDYAEDVRNGSLNAVSVALGAGSPDYHLACACVCGRAEELIQSSIQKAASLPMNCASAMVAHTGKLLSLLRGHEHSGANLFEAVRHAG